MLRAGEILKEERLKKDLSLEEISKATKIKESYLLSIENGDYRSLPASTYTQGFVRNYAKYLGLSEIEILAIFRREFDEEKAFKVLPEGLVREDFPIKKIKLADTVKILIPLFLILLLYILFQYRFAIISPPLEVLIPAEGTVVSSRTITVSGKTDSNATVFVNNETASLDTEGNFRKIINVFPGKTTIKVLAVNRFGKETIIERRIEVEQ